MLRALICTLVIAAAAPAMAIEGIETGSPPPSFELETLDGVTMNLEDHRGHTTAVLFWSTWSPRSAEMLADFKAHYEKYRDAGLRVLAVNADGENLTPQQHEGIDWYAGERDLPYPVLLDRGLTTYAAWGVEALPSAVIVDPSGKVSYSLGGYPQFIYREELRDSFLVSMGLLEPPRGEETVAVTETAVPAPPQEKKQACAVPRSRFCVLTAERQGESVDPAVMGVRLALCRGDAGEAQRMLRGLSARQRDTDEMRFALAHLLLLRGKNGAAEILFRSLAGDGSRELGDWGLGLVALAEGRTGDALSHMERAAEAGSGNTEAETAVLTYLLRHWAAGRSAPDEKSFLALFSTLEPIRECYGKLRQST